MFSFLKNIKDILNCLGYDKTRVRIQGEEVPPIHEYVYLTGGCFKKYVTI